jgi:large subunit ribosomal protein L4
MALTADLYNLEGKTEEKMSFPKEYFGAEINPALMAQAVRVYLSNQRKAAGHAKTRGEVIGSTHKIFRQKGTGRARHGDIKAPIFVGGGKAHGPTGEQNYHLVLSKKMRQLAIKSALTQMLVDKKVIGITGLEKSKGKVKPIAELLKKITKAGKINKLLLVVPVKSDEIKKTVGNLKNLSVVEFGNLNPYQVLNSDLIIITKEVFKVKSEKRTV